MLLQFVLVTLAEEPGWIQKRRCEGGGSCGVPGWAELGAGE